MTKDPTALTALRTRVKNLEGSRDFNRKERDRLQLAADQHQRFIDNADAEIRSIQAAIELLEAAAAYKEETP